ncbi:diaminopimelate epimerase [Microlunatus elymi]|uniref:Diaminopimelate epimerase n=1 Tax=Microlunatus elymi TaxID=2596828 RepID=A0A516Q154_9ACTN|nr:diaminopimelate epimerase [Microlunatus elymi]QDP97163.1 diaminopimelate epimerase [Microlunatus elymi]
MNRIDFAKGHGTENDFVIIPDPDGKLTLTADRVAAICDRHAGIGADGILRVVRSQHVPEWQGDPELWFMDYRNADGSIAEMCGNGVRVFAHYLIENDLAAPLVINIATRAGLRPTEVLGDDRYRVAMGPVTVDSEQIGVTVGGLTAEVVAFPVQVGNPHAVAFVDDLEELELWHAPRWTHQDRFPDGVNVEFVRRLGPHHVSMRVFERGSGETRSCGTGTVAVAAAAAVAAGQPQRPLTYRVDVPGGSVEVELRDRQSFLTGPAVIVAVGQLDLDRI